MKQKNFIILSSDTFVHQSNFRISTLVFDYFSTKVSGSDRHIISLGLKVTSEVGFIEKTDRGCSRIVERSFSKPRK